MKAPDPKTIFSAADGNRPVVRKAAYAGFSWMLGLFLGGNGNFGTAAAVLILSAACVLRFCGKKTALLCAVFAAAGIIYSSLYDIYVYRPIVSLDGENITFEGKITDITEYGSDTAGYEAEGLINGNIRAKIIIRSASKSCRISDEIHAGGTVSLITDSFTFPAHSYYRSKGIFVRMNKTDEIDIIPYEKFSLYRTAHEFSEYMKDSVKSVLSDEEGDMLCAMLTGDKSGLESSTKTKLYRAGCGHIMAVSGIHLTVIYSVISAILGMFPISRKNVFFLSMPFVIFFCFTAGLTPSVIRAAIMIIFLNIGYLAGRRSDVMNTLGICGIILTMKNPFAVTDSSLILSFAGVIGIGVISPKIIGRTSEYIKNTRFYNIPQSVINTAVGSFSVSTAVFPLTLFIFDEASLVSPITNMLMLPLCSASLILGAFGAVFGSIAVISAPLLFISGILCKPVLLWADFVYKADMLFIPSEYPFAKIISVILCFGVTAALMYSKDFPRTAMMSISVLLLGISAVTFCRALIPDDVIKFVYLCSGNSAAVIVHNGHTASVINIYGNGKADSLCEKYLRRKGIDKIDMIFINDKALSVSSAYKDTFELYEIASFAVPDDNEISDFNSFDEDIIFYNNNISLDAGYFMISDISQDEIIFDINGKKLAVYLCDKDDIGENMLFTAVCGRGNTAVSSAAKYALCSCGGDYSEGEYADNICAEITISENKNEMQVIFDGGGDRDSA